MQRHYCRAVNLYERTLEHGRPANLTGLSKRARQRLKWFDCYRTHGENARLTCHYFGISAQTFFRWKRRYSGSHLERLEDRSRRPGRVRQPCYCVELVEAACELRRGVPHLGQRQAGGIAARLGLPLPGIHSRQDTAATQGAWRVTRAGGEPHHHYNREEVMRHQ
jgi:transposase-like protein